MKKILTIDEVKKIYHDTSGEIVAIDNISLDIYDKELVAIVGPSGCGKTSLLSILSNLEEKSAGKITFHKENIRMGYMLQKDALFPWRTILKSDRSHVVL